MAPALAPVGVSDEVWSALEPQADQLEPAERRLLRRTTAAVAVVIALAIAVWWSGWPGARLGVGNSSGGMADSSTHTGEYEFTLVNRSVLPVTLTGFDVTMPGVLVTSSLPERVRLDGLGSERVTIRLRAADCSSVSSTADAGWSPDAQTRIGVDVARPWGTAHSGLGADPAIDLDGILRLMCGRDDPS